MLKNDVNNKFYIFIEIKFVSVVRIIIDSLTYINQQDAQNSCD